MTSRRGDEPNEFPPKKTDKGGMRNATGLDVVMNAYRVRLDSSVKEVYKYELKFVVTHNEREQDLTRGPKNDVAKESRRKLLWALFEIMLGLDDSFFGSGNDRNVQYCYDCGINMYAIRPLMERGEERRFSINTDKIPPDCRTLIWRNVENIEARLLAVETIDLFDKTAVAAISQGDRSVVQFLEVLSSQQMIRDGDHHIFPQKMFEKRSRHQLQRDPRILKDGMQKNVRYVGDSVEEAQPIIQIDPKKAAFFPAVSLGRFLEEIIPGGGSLETKLLDDRNFRMAVKQVKNLTVRANHLDSNRFFTINGLTKDGADRVKFEFEGRKISVAAYFSERYNIRLRFAKLPCVVEVRKVRVEGQTQKVENYYPIEVLDIEDGQRVPLQKQSGALTEQMIRQCQALPKSFKDLNEQQRDKASITSGNPYFKAHGIRPESQMLRAQAEVLFPPALVYGRDREEPQGANLMWRMGPQRQFLIAADAPAVWAAVIFQRGVEGNRCKEFLQRLVQSANNRGFPLPPPKRYDQWDDTDPGFIREKLAFYAQYHCSYIIFFTKDKMDSVHHTMKFFETEFPIVTQHISGATMEKGIGNKGAFLVLDNILMKMHLKLGGVNHGLSTARDMQRCNNIGHDIVANEWLAPTRMFIGLDLSHAGPQSLYERQSGQPVNDPTVVGMAYTCGEAVKIRGTYWLQEPRITIIQDLRRHIVEAIGHFTAETGSPPLSLVIYRSGVSEGEYRQVVTDEMTQIEEALSDLKKKNGGFKPPKVTIIVAQRQSNYRIVPKNVNPLGRPMEQNVPAGTVVDKTIMHPALTDVLMVGHKTIQGTARPVRYTVLVDQHDMELTEIEYITYHLCYTHGIVCSPVSVPGPLYSAGDLAKRGRNNWQQYNQTDTDSMVSGESGGRFRHDGSETFFEERSRELQPRVHAKFWA